MPFQSNGMQFRRLDGFPLLYFRPHDEKAPVAGLVRFIATRFSFNRRCMLTNLIPDA
jgi:hypothetical protein